MDYIHVYGPFVLMFDIKTKWSRGRRCRCSPPDSRRRWEAAPRSAILRSRSHFTVRHSPDKGWWEGSSQRDGDGWRTHTTAGISFLPVSQKNTYTAFTCTLLTVCRPREEIISLWPVSLFILAWPQCVYSRFQPDVMWHQLWFIKAAGKCSVLTCSTRRWKPSTLDWLD